MVPVAPPAPIDPFTGVSAARLGLYIHFPYCLAKCPYCDFAVKVADRVPQERYTEAILQELALRVPQRGRELHSVFFGGGTPSLWEPRWVARVLSAVRERFALAEGSEVSLEANPEGLGRETLADLRAAGVNRLSLGAQSFSAPLLRKLGRAHQPDDIGRAVAAAFSAGFENVSLDLIYGVPGETAEDARRDAEQAAALGLTHVSAYALTVESDALAEPTPFSRQQARGELHPPPEDDVVEMSEALVSVFADAGLARYEVSNFAREGYHSRHNALYWTGGEYLALGVGATGMLLSSPVSGLRTVNERNTEKYLARVEAGEVPTLSEERLGAKELFEERLAMGLRLRAGVDLRGLAERYAERWDERREREVAELVKRGMAERVDGRLRLTAQGLLVHSEIAARLM